MSASQIARPADISARRARGIGRLLYDAFGITRDRYFVKLARAGYPDVRLTHTVVLRHIGDDPVSLTDVAAACGISRQAVTKAARELESMGLLEIRNDPVDARAKLVLITGAGHKLLDVIMEVIEELEREFAAAFGRDQLEQLRAGLVALCKADLPPP